MNEQPTIDYNREEQKTKIDLYCPLAGRNCDRLSHRLSLIQQIPRSREKDLTQEELDLLMREV